MRPYIAFTIINRYKLAYCIHCIIAVVVVITGWRNLTFERDFEKEKKILFACQSPRVSVYIVRIEYLSRDTRTADTTSYVGDKKKEKGYPLWRYCYYYNGVVISSLRCYVDTRVWHRRVRFKVGNDTRRPAVDNNTVYPCRTYPLKYRADFTSWLARADRTAAINRYAYRTRVSMLPGRHDRARVRENRSGFKRFCVKRLVSGFRP